MAAVTNSTREVLVTVILKGGDVRICFVTFQNLLKKVTEIFVSLLPVSQHKNVFKLSEKIILTGNNERDMLNTLTLLTACNR